MHCGHGCRGGVGAGVPAQGATCVCGPPIVFGDRQLERDDGDARIQDGRRDRGEPEHRSRRLSLNRKEIRPGARQDVAEVQHADSERHDRPAPAAQVGYQGGQRNTDDCEHAGVLDQTRQWHTEDRGVVSVVIHHAEMDAQHFHRTLDQGHCRKHGECPGGRPTGEHDLIGDVGSDADLYPREHDHQGHRSSHHGEKLDG
ncbi:Uncharacterised protein [Mycobacteroides abscessus subsp. abscessus]|nr:Uncharacterised protein [Mycobacteroides abscessus subsp. abscessus]